LPLAAPLIFPNALPSSCRNLASTYPYRKTMLSTESTLSKREGRHANSLPCKAQSNMFATSSHLGTTFDTNASISIISKGIHSSGQCGLGCKHPCNLSLKFGRSLTYE
jgi:hypothetical protein